MSPNVEMKLSEVFAVLKPDLSVDAVPVSPTIYEELDSKYDHFKNHVLISEYEFTEDWSNWERHPAGDEIVILLPGQVEMVLRKNGDDERVLLTQAVSYLVVPAGTWHTAKTSVSTRMLFVTPGQGNENRADI